jgi:DnaK suppressor protein
MRKNFDFEYYKKLLLDRRGAITAGREARQNDAQPVELDQTRVGRLSRMEALQQQAMSQATIRQRQIHSATYGIKSLAGIRSFQFSDP